jgi:signal transduction histidine kinase
MSKFFWSAHPLRAILEAWPIGLLILFLLSRQVSYVSPFVLTNGIMALCGACGMWVVLRARVPSGGWLRQGLWELAVGLAVSLVMVLGMYLPARWFGWQGVWLQSSLSNASIATLLLLGTGPGYVLARAGVRVWFFWDRLRRTRLLWGITHAQLTLVVLLACFGALLALVLSPFSTTGTPLQPGSANLLTSLTERLLHTFLPWLSLVIIMTAVVLLALLPPSALVSFVVARKITRRLETLAETAKALRLGQYDARVAVSGEDEIAQLQADFNAMAGDLEQTLHDLAVQRDTVERLLQSRRELVASVSHELRTPVATVRALLESAMERREPVPASLHGDLDVAVSEVLRLQGLIDDLFSLSQTEAGGLSLKCTATDVAPVIQRMVSALVPLAWESGRVEVVAKVPTDLPHACVDEARLEQILSNLLRNGIRHTPPGGIVAVMAAAEERYVSIEVRDTGAGIAAEDLPHIWERFYRGSSSAGAPRGGAGLGLALVKDLSEAMGGTVEVQSVLGQGSCFTVRLPRA